MTPKTIDHFQRIQLVTESIKKNSHLLQTTNSPTVPHNNIGINGRLVLSDNLKFLEAIKNEIGGEIISDKAIGSFLYFETVNKFT